MRKVLHLLPHPGGGGERYVDLLSRMDGYEFERVFLSPSPRKADALRGLPRSSLKLLRSADLVHAHGEVASGLCLPALATRRSVVTFNGLNLLRRVHGTRRKAAVANLKLLVRATDQVICVGEAEYAETYSAVGPRLGARLVMIHNGVDLPPPTTESGRAAARSALGLAPEAAVGVYVGELSPHKDPITAVAAALRAEADGLPLVLLLAGDGPLRQALADAGGRSDGVRLLGYRSDIGSVLAAADFFVLPSLREGLSFALLEAMGLGLPPVTSTAPGNADAVGEAGILVPTGDIRGLAEAFRRLSDGATRAELGAAARERVARLFSADAMAEATRRVYDDVLR